MLRPKRRALVILVAALAVIGAGCSDDSNATATTGSVSSAEDIVFGSGELPNTIPANFPLPVGSAIGSTMLVTKTGFTEVAVRVSAEVGVTAQFFDQALSAAGFVIDSSAADGDGWLIEFSVDGTKGSIEITQPLGGVSQAVVRYNVP
ncbi:MAG: hypothetical protein U9N84_13815 [Actinomycetota bacterium]|nr:hypothetical protein [Actinomycetota bacterium]